MTAQTTFLDAGYNPPAAAPLPPADPPADVAARFKTFHDENPRLAALLRDKALALQAAGVTRYGMRALFEAMRFDHAIQTRGGDFKLNNNYTPHYAKLLMATTPQLAGFFETREH